MWSIRQTDTGWEVLDAAGVVLFTETSRELAMGRLATVALAAERTALAATPDGALSQRWVSGPNGIVLQADTGDGRDFTECVYTWRDPSTSLLPLMLQTTTDISHFGAVLAGWIDSLSLRADGGVDSAGWFYDSDAGRQFAGMLSAAGRFGVSVDPGAVEWEDVCTEYDEDGWCVDGFTKFLAYEVIGVTGTPFPAFADAWIELDASSTEAADDEPAGDEAAARVAVAAGATTTSGVDVSRFYVPEPPDDDPRYVVQDETGRVAIPLTIDFDTGELVAHAAAWGTCHIGFRDECVEPPTSPSGYAQYHLGSYHLDDGGTVPTGVLVVNCDHAARGLLSRQARQHYEHAALAWADVRAIDGAHGVWVCGQVRPQVLANRDAMRLLAASTLSGDWREFGTELDCIAIQTVNVPGFPIRREAFAASALTIAAPSMRVRSSGGRVVELAGAGIVRRARPAMDALVASGEVTCSSCGGGRGARARRGRGGAAAPAQNGAQLAELREARRLLDVLERRTRHLIPAARDHAAAQLATRRRDGA